MDNNNYLRKTNKFLVYLSSVILSTISPHESISKDQEITHSYFHKAGLESDYIESKNILIGYKSDINNQVDETLEKLWPFKFDIAIKPWIYPKYKQLLDFKEKCDTGQIITDKDKKILERLIDDFNIFLINMPNEPRLVDNRYITKMYKT